MTQLNKKELGCFYGTDFALRDMLLEFGLKNVTPWMLRALDSYIAGKSTRPTSDERFRAEVHQDLYDLHRRGHVEDLVRSVTKKPELLSYYRNDMGFVEADESLEKVVIVLPYKNGGFKATIYSNKDSDTGAWSEIGTDFFSTMDRAREWVRTELYKS